MFGFKLMRKMMWASFLGGAAIGGWSLWKLRGTKDQLEAGNWRPVPSTGPTPSTMPGHNVGGPAPTAPAAQGFTPAAGATNDSGSTSTPAAPTSAATPGVTPGVAWVQPDENGSCPVDFPVKANDGSKIFHVPGGRSYNRTKAERCYANPEVAQSDGYRAAKR